MTTATDTIFEYLCTAKGYQHHTTAPYPLNQCPTAYCRASLTRIGNGSRGKRGPYVKKGPAK